MRVAGQVRAMMNVLGVDPFDEHWLEQTMAGQGSSAAMTALDSLVQDDLQRRAEARAEKNWAVADEVRDRLTAAGIEVTDTPDGAQWSLKE